MDVDYRTTAQRRAWSDLPVGVRGLVEQLLGGRLVASASARGGFTEGFAAVVTRDDGSRAFVKAVDSGNEPILASYRREAEVHAVLPADVPAPRLTGTVEAEVDGLCWRVLTFQAVDATMPGHHWDDIQVAAVHEACLRSAEALAVAPRGLDLSSLAAGTLADEATMSAFAHIAGGRPVGVEQPDWLVRRAPDLQRLVDQSGQALAGEAAVHGDLRADNLLMDATGHAWICDWNWLSTGPGRHDWVGLLPMVRRHGVDADAWLARSPLSAGVDADAVDAFLAGIAAYMLDSITLEDGAERPPPAFASPMMRAHQRLYARCFLDWLGHRRGWQ